MQLFIANFAVTLTETFYTTRRIYKFLLTGEKRVAFGTDTYFDFRTGGLYFPDCAASANHFGIAILRMDVFFHFLSRLSILINVHQLYGIININAIAK